MDWPWSRQRSVPCKDGTTQYVFKNIDHAFPFFFKEARSSAKAALDGMKQIQGKVEAKYEEHIKHIFLRIDEKNGTVQAHLRAAYVVYSAAPCKKLDYLQAAIEAIRQDERDLRAAEVAIAQLVSLLSGRHSRNAATDPAVAASISDHLARIVSALTYRTPAAALADHMSNVARNVEEWRQP
jgi:hypothetical protein